MAMAAAAAEQERRSTGRSYQERKKSKREKYEPYSSDYGMTVAKPNYYQCIMEEYWDEKSPLSVFF
jgi:hypothetical protein